MTDKFAGELASVDAELSLKLAHGNSVLAKELFNMLLAQLPDDQHAIEKALETQDWSELQSLAHGLHGACCYVGVPRLKALAKDLETMLKSGETEVDEQVEALCREIEVLLGSEGA